MTPICSRFHQRSLTELVAAGENGQTEFKRLVHSPSKIAKPITAFANTEGGIILVGVDDDRRIVGIHSEKETLEVLHEALSLHIDPEPEIDFHVEEFKRRLVLMVLVPESPDKPHYHIEHSTDPVTRKPLTERRVYTREGNRNRALCDDRITLMQSKKTPLKLSFGEEEKMLLSYLQKHRQITAEEYSAMAGITLRNARDTLVALVRSGTVVLLSERKRSYYTLPAPDLP